jgi:hypothetical protein
MQPDPLRARLIRLRGELVEAMRPDGAALDALALLARVQGALAAIEAEALAEPVEAGS